MSTGRADAAPRALVAMSGGVDSSVAALLMAREGYECVGVTMKLWDGQVGPDSRTCCCADDAADARAAAYRLHMPYYVMNMTEDFDRQVIGPFAAEYEAGRTPNPCVECNRCMKFTRLWDKCLPLGCDVMATGHYARTERGADGRWLLKKAASPDKDQSYVLYMLSQSELGRTRFPLGALTKSQVRALAEERGLLNAHKRESQDICFVPDGDYASFLRRYTGRDYPPGDLVDGAGRVLGRHGGIVGYTIGQRRGLGVAAGRPLYVRRKDAAANTVVLGENRELFSRRLTADNINLIPADRLDGTIRCRARVRYNQKEQPASVTQTGPDELEVIFDQPQRAIAPGQAVVLYDGDLVLGGGTICRTEDM